MSNKIYTDLSWLLPLKDLKERCKAIESSTPELGKKIRWLANHGLNINQMDMFAALIERFRKEKANLTPLAPLKIGFMSDSTSNLINSGLVVSAARHGFVLELIPGGYGQVAQEAMDPGSQINQSKPDIVFLALDFRNIPFSEVKFGDPESEKAAVDSALNYVTMIRQAIHSNSGAPCIVQNLVRPAESLFGSYDSTLAGSNKRLVEAFNRQLADRIAESSDILFDVAALAETVGIADWNDSAQWFLGKLPFSQRFVPIYSEHFARLVAAMKGSSRKCLVLDLDNTVWGGIIGDDGLDGIRLAQGDAVGESFLNVQKMALELHKRGIMLAVCSKNQDENARLPFQKHPEMLLKEDHITIFQANWNDKASNIKAIADSLNIGVDSLVFMDDNPAERAQVREVLPEVAVPELPEDPSFYVRTVMAAGYFDVVGFSGEDLKRTEYYKLNAKRLESLNTIGDFDAYLASLDMEIHFAPFNSIGRARISQLINKSNQFNLTTRRLTEADVEKLETDSKYMTLQARLTDRFGDNGMISVIICEEQTAEIWEVHTWLMSCRVLKRKVETTMLNEIVANLRSRKVKKLIGTYIPTRKNKLVEDHYEKLGFTLTRKAEDQTTNWELDLLNFEPHSAPMKISRA